MRNVVHGCTEGERYIQDIQLRLRKNWFTANKKKLGLNLFNFRSFIVIHKFRRQALTMLGGREAVGIGDV